MTGFVLVLVVPLVLGLFVACVNLVVWRLRPSERTHLALALAGGAGAVLLGAAGMVYGADTRSEAVTARTALFLGAIPIQLCNVWLSERVYGVGQRVHYATMAGASLLWACVGLVPGVLYAPETVLRGTGLLGIAYLDVELTALGRLAPLTLVPGIAWFVWSTDRLASGDADRGVVLATMSVSGALASVDLLTAGAWIDAPYLYGTACTAAAIVYTALLLRRFVETLARVEASAELLQRAAEARARELRESDLQLAQGARLAALGTLAAGLAHEINNPVAFIRSNLNFLAEMAESGQPDPEFEEVLAETEEGVRRLRGIVDELLRMSAQGSAGFGEVQLSEVVESALPTLRFEARDDVALEARLAPVLRVRGDRNLLGQVVANLVLNAIQAVRTTGSPGLVRIATFVDGACAVLEVSDSGPGVAPEIAQRIFEPFFTTKPAGQGTGLGLAVSRQLVERHGGKLSLATSPRGARFRVELPLARAEAAGRTAAAAAPSPQPSG
jgi:signal transduction histidine kinase